MRTPLKVVIWLVVLAGCAGVGALIAARSNPFPPSVEDPGALPTPTASPTATSPSASPAARWTGTAVVRSTHRLFVGGSCRTDWRLRLRMEIADGIVGGTATAKLIGEPRCDFPTVQLQTQLLRLSVTGDAQEPSILLRFAELSSDPAGSIDLGGLVGLLDRIHPELQVTGDTAVGSLERESSDGDRGAYLVTGELVLARRV